MPDRPTTDEVIAALGGQDKVRELVKTALLFAADDIIENLRELGSDGTPHDHIDDDCGDYMHAALGIAHTLHSAWFNGGAASVADQLVSWAWNDAYAPPDEVGGMALSDLRMNHAGDGISPEVDDAVKTVRGQCLHLNTEED